MTHTVPTATTGPEFLAVHSVHEFTLGVPQLDPAREFFTAFGLDVRDEDGGLGLYTVGHPHRWARVLPGQDRKRLLWLSLGIHEHDIARFSARFDTRRIATITPPPEADPSGLWIAAPDGLPVQLRVAPKCSPSAPGPRDFPAKTGAGWPIQGRAPCRSDVQRVLPLYLSHILLFTPDVDAAMAFYVDLLGLRLSDRSGSAIAFLHSPHGSDHHLVALAKSDGRGMHHSSWCVPSVDAIGEGMEQMAKAGFPEGWGVGRHVLGSNYFRYVRDPWGSYAEYSFDIDYVEAGSTWPAADHAPEDSFYVWGPLPPDDFVVNYEIESSR